MTGDVFTWTYDPLDRRLTRDSDEGVISFTWNGVGNLSRIVNEHGELTTYAYDAAQREVRKLLANGTRVTMTYDAAGQTRSVRNYDSTHAVISLYTPVFRTNPVTDTIVTIIVFLVLVAEWCLVARFVGTSKAVTEALEKIEHWLVPAVFIGLGLYILIESGVIVRLIEVLS